LDGTRATVDVKMAYLQADRKGTRGEMTIGRYARFDMVRLGDHSEGVIYLIEGQTAHILLANGGTRAVTLEAILSKFRDQYARDREGNPIEVNQVVSVDSRKIRATVLHTTAHHVFLKSGEFTEFNGVFIVEPKECQVPVSAARAAPAVRQGFQAKPRRSELVGRVVRITRGQFKGHLADVKAADENTLRVVLHTNGRVENLNKSEAQESGKQGSWEWVDTRFEKDPLFALFGKSGGKKKPEYVQPTQPEQFVPDTPRGFPAPIYAPISPPNYGQPYGPVGYSPPPGAGYRGDSPYGQPAAPAYGSGSPYGAPSAYGTYAQTPGGTQYPRYG
jgi:transcription elongation factor